jgi:hypothetical protein
VTIDPKLTNGPSSNYKTCRDTIGDNGMRRQLADAVLERAREAVKSEHLDYEKHDPAGPSVVQCSH